MKNGVHYKFVKNTDSHSCKAKRSWMKTQVSPKLWKSCSFHFAFSSLVITTFLDQSRRRWMFFPRQSRNVSQYSNSQIRHWWNPLYFSPQQKNHSILSFEIYSIGENDDCIIWLLMPYSGRSKIQWLRWKTLYVSTPHRREKTAVVGVNITIEKQSI